jgi:hypothetical protein
MERGLQVPTIGELEMVAGPASRQLGAYGCIQSSYGLRGRENGEGSRQFILVNYVVRNVLLSARRRFCRCSVDRTGS